MNSFNIDGSPTPRKKSSINMMNFFIHEEEDIENNPVHGAGGVVCFDPDKTADMNTTDRFTLQQTIKHDGIFTQGDTAAAQPLTTSRLGNQMPPPIAMRNASFKVNDFFHLLCNHLTNKSLTEAEVRWYRGHRQHEPHSRGAYPAFYWILPND